LAPTGPSGGSPGDKPERDGRNDAAERSRPNDNPVNLGDEQDQRYRDPEGCTDKETRIRWHAIPGEQEARWTNQDESEEPDQEEP
jgi:hypothetical protein